jgi:hypothetical protein
VYRHTQAALKAFDGAESKESQTLVEEFKGWSGQVITGNYKMRSCDHQASYPIYMTQVNGSEEERVRYEIESVIGSEELLLSCEEMRDRMTCNVDL